MKYTLTEIHKLTGYNTSTPMLKKLARNNGIMYEVDIHTHKHLWDECIIPIVQNYYSERGNIPDDAIQLFDVAYDFGYSITYMQNLTTRLKIKKTKYFIENGWRSYIKESDIKKIEAELKKIEAAKKKKKKTNPELEAERNERKSRWIKLFYPIFFTLEEIDLLFDEDANYFPDVIPNWFKEISA